MCFLHGSAHGEYGCCYFAGTAAYIYPERSVILIASLDLILFLLLSIAMEMRDYFIPVMQYTKCLVCFIYII